MFSLSQEFHRARRDRNRAPRITFALTNAFGVRVYGDRHPDDDAVGLAAPTQADGAFLADGARTAGLGSMPLLDRGARVLSFGRLRESLSPDAKALKASLSQEEAGRATVVLSNAGGEGQRAMSRLEGVENLLGAVGELTAGFPGLPARDSLRRFRGRVTAYKLEAARLTLTLRAE